MMTLEDAAAIVKPHNDKIVAEHKLAEAERENSRLRAALTAQVATIDAWSNTTTPGNASEALIEVGKIARAALAKAD